MLSIASVILAASALVNPWPEPGPIVNPWPEEAHTCPIHNNTYDHYIEEAAATHNVSPLLIKAVIYTESKFQPSAKSKRGAVGLMQLMPKTARMLGVENRRDPRQNIMGGTLYLRMLLDQFNGNVRLAAAAFNAGPYAVIKHKRRIPPYKQTRRYVKVVMSRLAYLEAAQ